MGRRSRLKPQGTLMAGCLDRLKGLGERPISGGKAWSMSGATCGIVGDKKRSTEVRRHHDIVWLETPGADLLLEFLVKRLKPCYAFIDGAHIVPEDDVLRGRGTDNFRERLEVGRAPGGASRITDVVP